MIKDFLQVIKSKNIDDIFDQIDTISKQGIDLSQFAKQVLMYIDEHLKEDTTFLIDVSEVFTDILRDIKYYPYPTIVYKIAFNKKINKATPTQEQTTPQKQKIASPPSTTKTPKKETEKEGTK